MSVSSPPVSLPLLAKGIPPQKPWGQPRPQLHQLDVAQTAKNIVKNVAETPYPFLQGGAGMLGLFDLLVTQNPLLFHTANLIANTANILGCSDVAWEGLIGGRPDLVKNGKADLLKALQSKLKKKPELNLTNYTQLPEELQYGVKSFGQSSVVLSQVFSNTMSLMAILAPNSFVGEIGRVTGNTVLGGLFSSSMENKRRLETMHETGVYDPLFHHAPIYNLSTGAFYKRLINGKLTPEDKTQLSDGFKVMGSDVSRMLRQATGLLLPIDFADPHIIEKHKSIDYLRVRSAFNSAGLKAWGSNWKNAFDALDKEKALKPAGQNFGEYSLGGLAGAMYVGIGLLAMTYPILEHLGQQQANQQGIYKKKPLSFDPYRKNNQEPSLKTDTASAKAEPSMNYEDINPTLNLSHKLRKTTDVLMGLNRLVYYTGGFMVMWKKKNYKQSAVSLAKIVLGFGHTNRWAYWKNHVLTATITAEQKGVGKGERAWLAFKPAVQK
ncbi:MAG: hypothetical protein ACKO34_01960 [Vampirovibrionales bacterium]